MIKDKCECHIYSHVECYEEWLEHKKACLICKKEVYNVGNNTDIIPYFTIFVENIIRIIEPLAKYFIDNGHHWIGLVFFIILSFIFTCLLTIPMYVMALLPKLKNFKSKDDKKYKVYTIEQLNN
jgi:uncharacterized protein (DUF983 family)